MGAAPGIDHCDIKSWVSETSHFSYCVVCWYMLSECLERELLQILICICISAHFGHLNFVYKKENKNLNAKLMIWCYFHICTTIIYRETFFKDIHPSLLLKFRPKLMDLKKWTWPLVSNWIGCARHHYKICFISVYFGRFT